MFQRRGLLKERMNEQPGPFVQLRPEPPFLTSERVSPCSSVPRPPLFLVGHSHRAVHLAPRRKKQEHVSGTIQFITKSQWGEIYFGGGTLTGYFTRYQIQQGSQVMSLRWLTLNRLVVASHRKNAICNMTIWTRGFHPVSWKAILNFQKWVGILCLMKQPGQVLKNTLTETI